MVVIIIQTEVKPLNILLCSRKKRERIIQTEVKPLNILLCSRKNERELYKQSHFFIVMICNNQLTFTGVMLNVSISLLNSLYYHELSNEITIL